MKKISIIFNPHIFLSSLALMLIFGLSTNVLGDIHIGQDSGQNYTIVIPSKAPKSVKHAAKEFQLDIKLSIGAKLTIQNDDDPINNQFISLGMTKQAKLAGFSTKGMDYGHYRIVTKNDNLFIFGPDTADGKWTDLGGVSNATAFGVYRFLEKELGVRWLMPGELGRVVPKSDNFIIESMDRAGGPKLMMRYLSGVGSAYYSYKQRVDMIKNEGLMALWLAHLGVGKRHSAVRYNYNHNWWRTLNKGAGGRNTASVDTKAIRKLYKSHPEWFAMDKNGNRPYPKSYNSKLETTNQGLVKFFADQAIKEMKSQKIPRGYSLSPSDGYNWSQSPASKALLDPSPSEQLPDIDFRIKHFANSPSTSSLVLKWYHDIAAIVSKKYPKGQLAGFIYSSYLTPPQKVAMTLPKNFISVMAISPDYGYGLYRHATRKYFHYVIDSWNKVITNRWALFDLPNQLLRQSSSVGRGGFPGSTGIVLPAAPGILSLIAHNMVKYNFTGAQLYGVASWSDSAMANYMLAKVMWNPRLDPYKVQRDWLNHAYGVKAGEVMLQFYRDLDGWFKHYYQTRPFTEASYKLTLSMLKNIYAANYERMEERFIQAEHQPMTERQKKRLNLIKYNMIVLQWRLRNAGFLSKDYKSQLPHSDKKVDELLTNNDYAFPLFPGAIGSKLRRYPAKKSRQFPWNVQLSKKAVNISSSSDALPSRLSSGNTFLLYSKKDGDITITPRMVKNEAYFATYRIKNQSGDIVRSGLFVPNTPIIFHAETGQAYYMFIPPRKPVKYALSVDHASITKAIYNASSKTLVISDSDTPVLIFHAAGKTLNGMVETSDTVTISKPFLGGKLKKYLTSKGNVTNVHIVDSLLQGWRFHKDPNGSLLNEGVAKTNFDDSSWDSISVLNWWQMQDIKQLEGYHGSVWYRTTFDLPTKKIRSKSVGVYFGSVDGNAVIYINGHKLYTHKVGPAPNYNGWNKPFSSTIPVLYLRDNVLAVKVTSKNDHTGTGITGGVAIYTGQ